MNLLLYLWGSYSIERFFDGIMNKQKRINRKPPVKKVVQPPIKKPFVFPYGVIPFLFAFILFANTLPNKYCLDDYAVIVNNDYVHQGISGIPELLTTNYFKGWIKNLNEGEYRPIPMITYAVEYSIVGLTPWLRHLVNLLIYGLTGWLIFVFLRRLFKGIHILLPLSIAILYIAHPVHTESVANVKGRDDLLVFLFGLLAMYWFLNFIDNNKILYLGVGLLFFLLALLSKENGIAFIILIPLTLLFFRNLSRKQIFLVTVSLLVLTGIWWLWHSHIINSMGYPVDKGIAASFNNSVLSTSNKFSRFSTGLYIQSLYLIKLLFPVSLSDDYSFNQIPVISLLSFKAILSVIWIAGVFAWAVLSFKKEKIIFFSVLFYFITLFPVSNILVYIGATFAERFLYTPSFGFSVITGWLLFRIIKKIKTPQTLKSILSNNLFYILPVAGIILLYSILTVKRNFEWKNNLTLFSADASRSDNSARAHNNLGATLYAQAFDIKDTAIKSEYFQKAIKELHRSLAIYPTYQDAMFTLGNVFAELKQPDSALFYYKRILAFDSNYLNSYYNIGKNLIKRNNFGEAIFYLKKYLQYNPEMKELYYYLGAACGNTGKIEDAINYFEQYLKRDNKNSAVLGMLGRAYSTKGQYDKSLNCFLEALKLDPESLEFNFYTGSTYTFMNLPAKSIPYFEKCIRLNPNNKDAYIKIIQAYLSLGDKANADLYKKKLLLSQ